MGSSSPGDESRPQRIERVVNECLSRRIAGEIVSIEEIASSHAELMPELAEALRTAALIDQARKRARSGLSDAFAPPGYAIIRQIGRGGQGVVFEAVQRSTGRTVAVKWMRDGSFASAGDRMRFEREVRILAQLNHRNIVTIHDSGVTPAGDNFFVMKYITGLPLDEYVSRGGSDRDTSPSAALEDRTRTIATAWPRESQGALRRMIPSGPLSVQARLNLIQKVCDAIHAAHLRGIIHRDLKPSNIRVDDQGEPHILDFGLAKLSDHQSTLDGGPEFTQSGEFIGSLPWASPEQVEGRTELIDIRTDVYSLGVILFQVLTGRFPYPVLGHLREVMEHICRTAPTRPRSLRPDVDDEIETIVLKCLAKEPDRRSQSAGDLARDIGRYLAGEAIEAKRDSLHYVLRKQLRRYRVPLGIAASFVLLVIAGLGASLYLWRQALSESERARHAEGQARSEASKSQAALDFITEMFEAVDPVLARGHDVTVAEVIDPAATKVAHAFEKQPQAEAVVRGVLGHAFGNVGRYQEATRELRRAWELRQSLGHTEDAEALSLQQHLAFAMLQAGEIADSREILQSVLQKQNIVVGPESRETLSTRSVLALIRQLEGDVTGAIADTRAVLADQERVLGRADRDTLDSLASLADMLVSSGKLDDALAVAHDAAERASATHGADSNVALMIRSIEAEALLSLDRYSEGASLLEKVVKGKEKLYGESHPSTLLSLNLLASALRHQNHDDRALAINRTVAARATQSLGERHPVTLTYFNNLAQALRQTGHLEEAETIFRRILPINREVNGESATDTLLVMGNLGLLLMQRDKPADALPLLRDTLAGLRKSLPEGHWMIGVATMNVGRCQSALKEYADAEATLLDANTQLKNTLGAEHERTQQVRNALIELYEARNEPDKAKTWREIAKAPSQPTASQAAH